MNENIDAVFMFEKCNLLLSDVMYGYQRRFIGWMDVVGWCGLRVKNGEASDDEVEISLLLKEDLWRFEEIYQCCGKDFCIDSESKWNFIFLVKCYTLSSNIDVALDCAETVFADFNYPEFMFPFIRYMPMDESYCSDELSEDQCVNRMIYSWEEYILSFKYSKCDPSFIRSHSARLMR